MEAFYIILSMLTLSELSFMHFIGGIHIGLIHFLVYDTIFEARICDIQYYPDDETSFRTSPFLCRLMKHRKLSTTAIFKVYLRS